MSARPPRAMSSSTTFARVLAATTIIVLATFNILAIMATDWLSALIEATS